MLDIALYVFCFLLSAGLAYYLTPIMRNAAIRWGVVDKPDGRLKIQREPVPYLGGLAIFLSCLISLSLVYTFQPQLVGLLLGATLILVVGLVDDFGVLTPVQKFMGQGLAVLVAVKSGIVIQIEYLPFWVNYPLTFFWMLGVINAVNLTDISDGLAGSVSFAASLSLFCVAAINGHAVVAIVALTLAGSLLGFLMFNWQPARIYMGDAGSLFLGFILGALAMMCDYSDYNPLAYVAPIFILAVPIFDTTFVTFVRLRKGLPPFLGSPDHFPLRLKRRGLSAAKVALILGGVTLALGGLSIWLMFQTPLVSMIVLGAFLLLCVILGLVFYFMEPAK